MSLGAVIRLCCCMGIVGMLWGGDLLAPAHAEYEAPMVQASDDAAAVDARPPDRRNRHTIRFGVGYQPGPGTRLLVNYIYAGLPSGAVNVWGGWGEQFFGSVGYTHQVRIGPRVSLLPSVTVFSYYEPNRLLDGVQTDERRSGLRTRIRLQRRPADVWQQSAHAEAEFSRIWLGPADQPNVFRDQSTLELGGQAARVGQLSFVRPDLVAGVRLRGGWKHADDAGFVEGALAGRWHPELGRGVSLEFDGRLEGASAGTPVHERPSFGGLVGVRGYRPDRFTGRTLSVLQSELWLPIPGTEDAIDGVAALLGRHVRVAAFGDVGHIGATADPEEAGVRSGFGMGLRLRLGGITLRVDWGHQGPDLLDGQYRGDIFVGVRPDGLLFLFDGPR